VRFGDPYCKPRKGDLTPMTCMDFRTVDRATRRDVSHTLNKAKLGYAKPSRAKQCQTHPSNAATPSRRPKIIEGNSREEDILLPATLAVRDTCGQAASVSRVGETIWLARAIRHVSWIWMGVTIWDELRRIAQLLTPRAIVTSSRLVAWERATDSTDFITADPAMLDQRTWVPCRTVPVVAIHAACVRMEEDVDISLVLRHNGPIPSIIDEGVGDKESPPRACESLEPIHSSPLAMRGNQ